MTEHFLTYEQSLEVKELGFDEPCMKQWTYAPVLIPCTNGYNYPILKTNKEVFLDSGGDCISAPLKSQFFKWVDENTPYQCFILPSIKEGHFHWQIINLDAKDDDYYTEADECYVSRTEAEDACINKIIELLKLK